jgi:hypothetical protein
MKILCNSLNSLVYMTAARLAWLLIKHKIKCVKAVFILNSNELLSKFRKMNWENK